MIGKQLEQAISTYSVKIADGARVPVEVTDGLRVLGAPIGSSEFAFQFIPSQSSSKPHPKSNRKSTMLYHLCHASNPLTYQFDLTTH
jgi:hypothetical protein